MNSWVYYSETIDRIYWLGVPTDDPVRRRVRANLREHPELAGIAEQDLQDPAELPGEHNNAGTILVRRGEPGDFGRCPGTHGHLCCNYLTFNVYVGCTLGCTYCIMQSYLRNRTLEVRIPHPEAVAALRRTVEENRDRTVRIGTGEVGDSLLYDPLFGISADLVRNLEDLPNVRFELKTKTDFVDHLPERSPGGGGTEPTMITAFSVNPQGVIDGEEGVSASLEERLAAAQRARDRGYGVAFHFDPMIHIEGWEVAYGAVVDRLAGFHDPPPAWISLGTLRYPTTLRPSIEARPYGLDEYISAGDGKMRYLQKVRAEMYRTMRARLSEVLPESPVYMCMESAAMWRHLQERAPDRSQRLRDIMRPVRILRTSVIALASLALSLVAEPLSADTLVPPVPAARVSAGLVVAGEDPAVVRMGQGGSFIEPNSLNLPRGGEAALLSRWDWLRSPDAPATLSRYTGSVADEAEPWLYLERDSQGIVLSRDRFELVSGSVQWRDRSPEAPGSMVTVGSIAVQGRGQALIQRGPGTVTVAVAAGRFELLEDGDLIASLGAGQHREFRAAPPEATEESFSSAFSGLQESLDRVLAVILTGETPDGAGLTALWDTLQPALSLYAEAESRRSPWVVAPEARRHDLAEGLRILASYDYLPPAASGM